MRLPSSRLVAAIAATLVAIAAPAAAQAQYTHTPQQPWPVTAPLTLPASVSGTAWNYSSPGSAEWNAWFTMALWWDASGPGTGTWPACPGCDSALLGTDIDWGSTYTTLLSSSPDTYEVDLMVYDRVERYYSFQPWVVVFPPSGSSAAATVTPAFAVYSHSF